MTGMVPGSRAPPTPGDIGLVRGENRVLKAHLQQLQDDLQAEQGTASLVVAALMIISSSIAK